MRQLTIAAARRTALAAQGFADRPPAGAPTARHLKRVYDRTAVMQIDSVNVLTRAHYLPAYSRLGPYDRAAFDRLEHPRRRVFEYWAHMASLSPVEHHPLLRWRMADSRERTWGMIDRIAHQNPGYVEEVRAQIAESGPLTAAQVDPARTGKIRGQMWSWHHGKAAVEWLFRVGEVTSVRRNEQFERVYDLTDRVIPPRVLGTPTPTPMHAQRELLALAARAHGVATARHLRDYYRLRGRHTDRLICELVEDGVLEEVRVRGLAGRWFLHRDARVPRRVERSALLSPFDPLVWERDRTLQLWGCHYRIEIYTPAHKRLHGYYVLPYLLDERIAARVDLKADRAGGVLRVQAAHLEPDSGLEPGYVAARLDGELQRMAGWLGLGDVVVMPRGDLAGHLGRRTPSIS
ncbi:winged helix-turn-helix domain-containing protein [Blastococcus sp. Marseille-P5729]|uniref:winged helix-turn-helix domain-containing protein n=1 Tax=Blastococcus sp. Marseille-P5729 TaxID=2086582 RepID=UPI000D113062|nr:crosslink repair DNA glycosylase YcaQ family protein [Blastococcus sp. Marseille-P5729]